MKRIENGVEAPYLGEEQPPLTKQSRDKIETALAEK